MKIEVNTRIMRRLWKKAGKLYDENPRRDQAWIAAMTIMALAGKESHPIVKGILFTD